MQLSKSAQQQFKSVEMEAMIIRADGTRENLGVIASWHRNPFIRIWRVLRRYFK